LEVGAEGGFKLDLRLDCDPGKQQELKGAVRTETYRRHYCQHYLSRQLSFSQYLWRWDGDKALSLDASLVIDVTNDTH
jgi:hypothetical protein